MEPSDDPIWVADTSALVALGVTDCFPREDSGIIERFVFDQVIQEISDEQGFDTFCDDIFSSLNVHITKTVAEEIDEIANHEKDDLFSDSADHILDFIDSGKIEVHDIEPNKRPDFGGIDLGESSCIDLCRELNPAYLLIDEVEARPRLKKLLNESVELRYSATVLVAFSRQRDIDKFLVLLWLDKLGERRNWFESEILQLGFQALHELL